MKSPEAPQTTMSKHKLEYIWLDGYQPTQSLRSKTLIRENFSGNVDDAPVWAFDGSSTEQAGGGQSDCLLTPVAVFQDPDRFGGNGWLVMAEVQNPDGTAHESNGRATINDDDDDFWFGFEQEYTLLDPDTNLPLGFPHNGFPAPQGPFYTSVGARNTFGRDIVDQHLHYCIEAGLNIEGINAEVMMGQWEFQIGPIGAPAAGDHLWVARWLLYRIGEQFNVSATLAPKPVRGDWNGAGAHTNFSTVKMRNNYDACVAAAEALGTRAELHIANYGDRIEERLTGEHETCSYKEFRYGVSDRGASIRIPWQVARDQKGYIEDRRPNANCDPYVVTQLILDTVCGAAAAA